MSAASEQRRRRGVVPADLNRRIENCTAEFMTRWAARMIAGVLDGVPPSALTEGERADLKEIWGDDAQPALDVLAEVGYGAPGRRKPRRERGYGVRRDERLEGVIGKLPRALALRMPTTADTHRSGRNDGRDRWGRVKCSRTLRPDHVGLVAALGGLWHSRAGVGEGHVDLTAGELVQLLSGRKRVGGKDVVWVHRLLAELEDLELTAVVEDIENKPGPSRPKVLPNGFVPPQPDPDELPPSGPSQAHHVPSSPIDRVERRIGDRWIATADYAAALAEATREDGRDLLELRAAEQVGGEGMATIRVHLAKWVRAELAHDKRRPVFVDFTIWAHLRPSARRLHTWLQGHGRDDFDGRRYFYLGKPTLYTLGLAGRKDRVATIVRHDLTAIYHADRRYHDGDGFRQQEHARTGIPAFAIDAARIKSCPTPKASVTKCAARRPTSLRGALARVRRHSVDAAHGRGSDARARRLGIEAARREADQVREAIYRSMGAASASAHEAGPFDPGRALEHRRRQARGSQTDDDSSS